MNLIQQQQQQQQLVVNDVDASSPHIYIQCLLLQSQLCETVDTFSIHTPLTVVNCSLLRLILTFSFFLQCHGKDLSRWSVKAEVFEVIIKLKQAENVCVQR